MAQTNKESPADCQAPTGTIMVSNSCSGSNQPLSPFTVFTEHRTTGEELVEAIPRNGSLTETVTSGDWFVTLVGTGIGPGTNWGVPNQRREITVPAGGSVSTSFTVTCD